MGARSLWALCGLWAAGRLLGVLDWSGPGALSALADLGWLTALLIYIVWVSWQQRTSRLLGFALWLGLLAACVAAAKGAALAERVDLASTSVQLAGFGYFGLLGLALARITVPVTNRILDSTQKTAPFRPNPGRFNLAPGLILVAMAGEVAGLSTAVSGFLLVAAGAAFMDRVGEHFVGRLAVRSEILMLAGAAALAGTGLMMTGAARLGAPWPPGTGLHVALMGGLGLGFFAVFCIAGLLQSGRPLGVPATPRLAALLIPLAVGLRVAPDLGVPVPGPVHSLVVVPWGAAFLLWLYSNQLKRLPLVGNLVIAALSGLAVWTVSLHFPQNHLLVYTYAIFAFAISLLREIVKDMEDMQGDESFGCKTLPILLGIRYTKFFLYFLSALFIFLLFFMAGLIGNQTLINYFLILVIPITYFIFRLVYADTKKEFTYLSAYCKVLMLSGILSMLFF